MSRFHYAFDWAQRAVRSERLPTAVLGIATSEGVQAVEAFGATGDRRADVSDYFPLFSVTKPIVGLAALRQVERGLLTPDTPLALAVPDFGSGRDDTVRLRHLVSHTSGIPDVPLDAPRGLRESLLTPGRIFAAGTASRYSSIAFEGIAALIEHVTGEPWRASVDELLKDAGAEGITFDPECDAHPVCDIDAAGFDYKRFQTLAHPGAGLFARVQDILALGVALLRDDGAVASPLAIQSMRRPLTEGVPRLEPVPAGDGQDWGFTWNVRNRAPGLLSRDVYGHSGWAGCQFWINPATRVAYALLTNRAAPERFDVDFDELQNAVDAAA